jgi:hypothetical protein
MLALSGYLTAYLELQDLPNLILDGDRSTMYDEPEVMIRPDVVVERSCPRLPLLLDFHVLLFMLSPCRKTCGGPGLNPRALQSRHLLENICSMMALESYLSHEWLSSFARYLHLPCRVPHFSIKVVKQATGLGQTGQ